VAIQRFGIVRVVATQPRYTYVRVVIVTTKLLYRKVVRWYTHRLWIDMDVVFIYTCLVAE
jgi:hypothetical protein